MSLIIKPGAGKPSKVITPSSGHLGGGFKGETSVPFRVYHRRNDPVMVPDRGFTKQLKAFDPELEVVWDWVSNIWAIWCFPKDGRDAYHVMDVCTSGKTYRALGQDILLKLSELNRYRGDTKRLLAYIDEHNAQVQRRKEREFREKIKAMVGDTFNYARGVLQIQVPRSLRVQEVLR